MTGIDLRPTLSAIFLVFWTLAGAAQPAVLTGRIVGDCSQTFGVSRGSRHALSLMLPYFEPSAMSLPLPALRSRGARVDGDERHRDRADRGTP